MQEKIAIAFLSFLFSSLLFASCISRTPPSIQKTAAPIVEEPPKPPSLKEVQSPPNLILEKSPRDPFVSLELSGTAVSKKGREAPSEGFSVSGILSNQKFSAIVNSLENSYIVHRGDRIKGYRVVQITPRSVILEKGTKKLVLSLAGR